MNDRSGPSQPAWHFMRQLAHRPHSGRPLEGEGTLPPREVTAEDLRLLRGADGAWNPQEILECFGPAGEEASQLGHLVVACAVFSGAHRIRDIVDRLIVMSASAQPRVRRLLEDDALHMRRPVLRDLLARLNSARQELSSARARAANDQEGGAEHPDGLRYVDLDIMSDHVRTQVVAHEIATRRNVAGLDFGLRYAQTAPRLEYAEEWLERLTGTPHLEGVLLFWPREYGRVVVVFEDGRLAYDPGAPSEDDTPSDQP